MIQDRPEGWTVATVGDLAEDIQSGFACGEHTRDQTGVPHLRPMNVDALGGIALKNLKYVGQAQVDRDERVLHKGDVLFNNTNSPELVGKTAYYGLSETVAFSNHMTRVRCRREVVDAQFLALSLHSLWRQGYFEEHCSNHVSQASISRSLLAAVRVLVPPLAEQQRIVTRVESLLAQAQAARQRLERVQHLIDAFRRSVLTAACTGGLTADWRESHPANDSGQDLIKALLRKRAASARARPPILEPAADDLPDLPPTWAWTTLDVLTTKVVDGVHRTPAYQDQGIPFLTVRNLTAGPGIDFLNVKYVRVSDHDEFIKRTNPQRGDLLISKDGTLGVVRAVRTDQVFSIFVSVALIKPIDRRMTDYLELALSSGPVQARLVPTGSGLQHLHLRDLKASPVPVPPAKEQHEIVRRVRLLFSLSSAVGTRLALAASRVDAAPRQILAKAFAGELVPTEAEFARVERRTYESGEELLARVRAEREATTPGAAVFERSRVKPQPRAASSRGRAR